MRITDETPPATNASFRLGSWLVDPAACELRNGDEVVRLRPKVMELLTVFARHPGEVLSKHSLLDLVWPDVTVGDASLTVAVAELREALGDPGDAAAQIETIPRRGYRLNAQVSGAKHQSNSDPAEASRFWLTGDDLRLVLLQGENLIGRAPDARVHIESAKVSRRHARIVVEGDTATIEDLGSKNGTFVDGSRVQQPTPLAHGDQIRLGQLAAVLQVVVSEGESTITELSQEAVAIPSLSD